MDGSFLAEAQQAVNLVAPMQSGEPEYVVAQALRQALAARRSTLPEPYFSRAVRAIAAGQSRVILLP